MIMRKSTLLKFGSDAPGQGKWKVLQPSARPTDWSKGLASLRVQLELVNLQV
jgi:hypothetical protein